MSRAHTACIWSPRRDNGRSNPPLARAEACIRQAEAVPGECVPERDMSGRRLKLPSLSKGARRREPMPATLLISDFVLAFQCITSGRAVAAKGWTATGLELVKAPTAAILPSCAAAKVFSHDREGRKMSRLQRALVAGAITLGSIVVGSLCPTMLGGGAEWASSTSQSDFQILSSGFSR
jgi:hypothetical protein